MMDNYLLPSPRYLPKDGEFDFWDTDTEEHYINNVRYWGDQWRWTNRKFTYKINRQGYRGKNIEDIDLNNYMAAIGCSFTAGIGLPIENTWAYKISQQENLDLLNAGLPGASNNLIFANFIRIVTADKKPKFIIINWTDLTRAAYWSASGPDIYIIGHKVSKNTSWDFSFKNRIMNSDVLIYEFKEIYYQVNLISNSLGVPVWHLSNFTGYESIEDFDKIIYQYHVGNDQFNVNAHNEFAARDIVNFQVSHPGIVLQERILARWNELKERYLR